ncbi:hypothetical protein V6N13_067655 [Hibiscus sabdariffa]|uniref:Protein kinase domain-containing protein n=1 Tax=Hibiscus sabdariffa TaxID=183260 RepID=A0ABR2DU23_9ROSI
MLLRKLLWRRAYNEKVDIWSASAVLYVMSGGAPPFYGETAEENLRTVLRGDFKRNFRSLSLKSPKNKRPLTVQTQFKISEQNQ